MNPTPLPLPQGAEPLRQTLAARLKVRRWRLVLPLILAAAPFVFLACLVRAYGVDVPYWDQWGLVPMLQKYHAGTLTLADLFQQHNESRPFFPRLIGIALASMTGWNVKWEMALLLAFGCVISASLFFVGTRTCTSPIHKLLWLHFLANVLLFAPAGWETWLMGDQLTLLLSQVCIFLSVGVFQTRVSARTKTIICSLLALVSTYSFASGLLCWFVWLPLLMLSSCWRELWDKRWLLLAWAAGCGLSAFTYFRDYSRPSWHPPWDTALGQPAAALRYFLRFFGNPLAPGTGLLHWRLASAIGLAVVLAYAGCILYMAWFRDLRLAQRLMGWLAIGAYSLATGVAVTLARLGFGLESVFSPRYVTLSVPLFISLLYMGVVIGEDFMARSTGLKQPRPVAPAPVSNSRERWYPRFLKPVLVVLLCGAACLHVKMSIGAVKAMQGACDRRLHGRACLMFIDYVQADSLTATLFPYIGLWRERANFLDSVGWLRPPLLKDGDITRIEAKAAAGRSCGCFESLARVADGQFAVTGWAILPDRKSLADTVVISYAGQSDRGSILGLADSHCQRPDVAGALGDRRFELAGFSATVSTAHLPPGRYELRAWAVDGASGKAYCLANTHELVIER